MSGAEAVVVGRSNIVGKPVSMLLTRENATVTVTHSRTRDLKAVCKRADILVVQSNHFARVKPDGSFELSGVPMGTRKIVLWSPGLKPATQSVEVTASGANVSFTPEAGAIKPHMNKFGKPYGGQRSGY